MTPEEVNKLGKHCRHISDISDDLHKGLEALNIINNERLVNEDITPLIDVYEILKNKIDNLSDKAFKLHKSEKEKMIKECDHNYVYEGHDSHKDYYTCTKCGHWYSV